MGGHDRAGTFPDGSGCGSPARARMLCPGLRPLGGAARDPPCTHTSSGRTRSRRPASPRRGWGDEYASLLSYQTPVLKVQPGSLEPGLQSWGTYGCHFAASLCPRSSGRVIADVGLVAPHFPAPPLHSRTPSLSRSRCCALRSVSSKRGSQESSMISSLLRSGSPCSRWTTKSARIILPVGTRAPQHRAL